MRQFMDWSRTNPSRHDDYAAILVWCELKKKKKYEKQSITRAGPEIYFLNKLFT